MFEQLAGSPFLLSAVLFVVIGFIFIIAGVVALLRTQIGSFTLRAALGLAMLAIGGLAGIIAFGINGFQTLTREEIAARISVSPLTPQHFAATFRYPDGKIASFNISGDEIYIDAHILKWQPIANLFGLHTAYELDRIGGRYREIAQEQTGERTIYSLGQDKIVNLFALRQRHAFLALLLDAKYGSATFIPVTKPAEFELRVSTTGLLLREINTAPK